MLNMNILFNQFFRAVQKDLLSRFSTKIQIFRADMGNEFLVFDSLWKGMSKSELCLFYDCEMYF